MAEQKAPVAAKAPSGEIPSASNPDETIRRLTEEKRILEEKNKKFAMMLDICAKNSSKGGQKAEDNAESAPEDVEDLKEQLGALKKQVAEIGKRIEKNLTDNSSEQWKTVMSEMKARFSAIDAKIATIDNMKALQKKLDELEAVVRDKRRHGGNPFGNLGAIGAESPPIPEVYDPDKDIIGKLEEFEQKIDRLGNRISTDKEKHDGFAEKGGRIVHKIETRLEAMLPANMRTEVEKIKSKFAGAPAIDFAPVDAAPKQAVPPATPAPATPEEKVPEEVLEGLIFGGVGGKLKIKIHEPSDFEDVVSIKGDIRAGDIILVNIKALKQNDMDTLKKIVDQLKRTCAAVDGNITGIGENYIAIMPKNVQLHKETEDHKEIKKIENSAIPTF